MAIEDAAALANALWKGDLRRAMGETRAMDDIIRQLSSARLATTKSSCGQSEFLTRLQAGDSMLKRLFARYVFPALHDLPAASSAAILRGAQRLEFVGFPERARRQHTAWALAKNLRGFVPRPHVLFLICGGLLAWFASGWVWNLPSKLDTTIVSHV